MLDFTKSHRAAVGIIVAATLLLIIFRFHSGTGIGLVEPDESGKVTSGFLFGHADNLSYVSWAKQAQNGSMAFYDLFTTEPHEALYTNPYFLVLGWIARLLKIQPVPLFILFGIVASMFVLVFVYRIALLCGFSRGAALWSLLLASFASGLSLPLAEAFKNRFPIAPGADLGNLDAFYFSTFYAYPYHSVAYVLLCFLVIIFIRATQAASLSKRSLLLMTLLSLLLTSVHPYEVVLFIAAVGIFLFLSRSRKIWVIWLVITAGALPPLLYNFWISKQPVWQHFANVSLNQPRGRIYWLTGYGFVLPAALLGCYLFFRRKDTHYLKWIPIAVLLITLLLLVLDSRMTKIANGSYLYFCLMAGFACDAAWRRVDTTSRGGNRFFLKTIFVVASLLFFVGSPMILFTQFKDARYSLDFVEAAKLITKPGNRTTWVLCNTEAGCILPAITGARVYSGHWSLSPGYFSDRRRRLIEAGIQGDAPGFPHGPVGAAALKSLWMSSPYEYLLVRKDRPAFSFANSADWLELVQCFSENCLFRRKQP